jgi:DNA-binding XRE family transcriptional regulator
MQELTKKHPTEETVTLRLRVHPLNVERIRRYVARIEQGEADTITLDEFFERHFTDEAKASVCLRGARGKEELTQRQLAELTGIPQRHISEMESGKRVIGKETAHKLAKALNCDYRIFL